MSTQILSPCKWAVRPLEWTGSADGPRLQAVEGFWKTCEGGYPHKVSTSQYLELSLTPMLIVNLMATSFHPQRRQSIQRWTHTIFLSNAWTPTEERGSAGNRWIRYGAWLQAKIGLWGIGEGHERCVLMLLCSSCTILTAVIVSQHIVNISAKDNATGKSQSMTIASATRALRRWLLMLTICSSLCLWRSQFSFKQFFYWQRVSNFVLLPTKHRNDTREGGKGNNNACTKTQQSDPMCEHWRKGMEVQEQMDTLRTTGVWCLRAGIGS